MGFAQKPSLISDLKKSPGSKSKVRPGKSFWKTEVKKERFNVCPQQHLSTKATLGTKASNIQWVVHQFFFCRSLLKTRCGGYFGSKRAVKWPLSLCSGSTFNKEHITGMMAVVVRTANALHLYQDRLFAGRIQTFRKTEPPIDLPAIKILLINEETL